MPSVSSVAPTTSVSRSTEPPSTASTSTPTTRLPPNIAYLYLYPFANLAEVTSWQRESAPGGHQPWRLDAGLTAKSFAQFLGYTQASQVLSQHSDSLGAHVAVGFRNPNGAVSTAAVVHLVRVGSGTYRPWEVVGTDDTNFTLDTPIYRTTITSPVRVGGHITGVDDNITVHVQQLHANGYLGERCCVPAGGQNAAWSATVTFARPTDQVLILSASTGGHLQTVERFAVTGAKFG